MNRRRKAQLYFLTLLLLALNLIVLAIRPTYLFNLIIVYALPTLLVLSWDKTQTRNKILIFGLTAAVLFAPPIELMARLTNSWDVQSTLPRIFGISPMENLFYAFINFVFPVAFYKHFTEKDKKTKPKKLWKSFVVILVLLSVTVNTIFAFKPELISWHYWQIAVIFLGIPAIIISYLNPKILIKALPTTFFFAVLFLVHELISLFLGHWWWPGEYLLPISVFGKTFPIDDVLIWYLLSTPVLIGGYEFFFDDMK